MIRQAFFFLILCCISSGWLLGQQDDPVLFTVEDQPVHVSEFLYIYQKTNREEADFSKKSLEEYLDLYTKFKLKVQRAKDLKLDTIPSLQNELEGYRRQLADSYLIDKEVTEKLVKEAYERSKYDISVSHILVALKENASPQDTAVAYQRIMQIKSKLDDGGDFEQTAKSLSDDPSAKNNGGKLGYFTALFPNGFYEFETAAYSLKEGQYSNPVRTNLGYHIIKVDDIRPARGEMEAAHILLRHKSPNAKENIDSIYSLLQEGRKFEDLADVYSDDKKTAAKGGYIGYFGISQYEQAFEDAAFALKTDGEYSEPVKTKAGWHIIKRISRHPIPSYEEAKTRLKARVQKDQRLKLAEEAMVENIKKEYGFKSMNSPLSKFGASLDKEFLTYRWKAPAEPSDEVIFVLGEEKKTLGDFTEYLEQSARERIQLARTGSVVSALTSLYNDFVTATAIKYEEQFLEEKYPDFKALMREYREGILLFEITKQEVWDKASQDTTGLRNFYKKNKNNYKWGKRAVVSTYTLNDAAHLSDKIGKVVAKSSPEEVLKKYNGKREVISQQEVIVERGRNEKIDALKWEPGFVSEMEIDRKNKTITFMKVEEILEPSVKALKEARGYVVADFQDYLEQEWLSKLKKAYDVDINKRVFKSLIKK